MTMKSERYERVITAANGGVPDRVPWGIWAHYPAITWLKYYSWELANRNWEQQVARSALQPQLRARDRERSQNGWAQVNISQADSQRQG